MNKDVESKSEDRGCLTALGIILGCIVGAGAIHFTGRILFGEDGSFIFFYSILGTGIAFILFKTFWDKRKKR